jgi:hypothetical protein
MGVDELIEKLKSLIGKGVKISSIEKKLGLPKNNLSSIINGIKKMPEKWKPKLELYILDTEQPPKEDWEIELENLLDTPEHKKLVFDAQREMFDSGIVITKKEEERTTILRSGTKEWFDVLQKVRVQDLTNQNQNSPKEINTIPAHPKREDFTDAFEYAAAKNDWKKKYNL